MLLYSLYMNAKNKQDYPCVTSSLLFGILLGTFLIPVIFYTYSGILGANFLPLDIATFMASVFFAFLAAYKCSLSGKQVPYTPLLKLSILIITICFCIFTYHPPNLGLFIDPTKLSSV